MSIENWRQGVLKKQGSDYSIVQAEEVDIVEKGDPDMYLSDPETVGPGIEIKYLLIGEKGFPGLTKGIYIVLSPSPEIETSGLPVLQLSEHIHKEFTEGKKQIDLQGLLNTEDFVGFYETDVKLQTNPSLEDNEESYDIILGIRPPLPSEMEKHLRIKARDKFIQYPDKSASTSIARFESTFQQHPN